MLSAMLSRLGAKVFYCLTILVYVYATVLTLYLFSVMDLKYTLAMFNRSLVTSEPVTESKPNYSVINILQWTDPNMPPFDLLKRGRNAFVDANCKYNNCYVTSDKKYLNSITDFEVIIFNGKTLTLRNLKLAAMPKKRSRKQKYIYVNTESSHYYPICDANLNSYFNFTYTYRIDSDFRWGYVTVYDLHDKIIGPKIDMNWPLYMDPINDELKETLKTKSKAAAWFVSNCGYVKSGRNEFVRELLYELETYKLYVDVYGKCGSFNCSKSNSKICNDIIKKDYYFYLSFENSLAEDYVTEKLITALNNYAVPVVFGGAKYSRFMPPGSYLNARELGVKKLAESMNNIIKDKNLYHDFFRWRNHFKYKETTFTEDVCTLCEVLNDKQKMNNVTIVEDLRSWWNGMGRCRKMLV